MASRNGAFIKNVKIDVLEAKNQQMVVLKTFCMETDKTKLDNDKILKLINNKDQMKHLTIWNTQPKWKYMHLKNFRLKSVNLVQRSIPNQL